MISGRFGNLLVLIISLISISVIFVDFFLFPGQLITSGWRDILTVNLPEIIYTNWSFPLWNNLWLTGFPAIADAMSNIYYPFVYLIIQTIDSIILSTNIIIVTHIFIGFITSYLFFSLLIKNKGINLIFSLSYIFSFVLLSRIDAGHEFILVALAWIPLLYYATVKILYKGENSVKNIILFSISSTLIVFSGSLYYVVYPFIFIAIYALYLLVSKKVTLKNIFTLGIASALFLLITAIKSIPILILSDSITRIDTVGEIAYSLESGGSLESNLASLIFGTKINLGYEYFSLDLAPHESGVLIGAISVFLIIIALVYGKRIVSIPSFLIIAFSFIWAAAGKTIFSFIHLLPFLDSLRCPGRIWGGALPILIILSAYGLVIIINKISNNESFCLNKVGKRRVLFGILILSAIKISELPFQENLSIQSILSLILILIFVSMIYFNKITKKTLVVIFLVALLINSIVVFYDFSIDILDIIKSLIIGIFIVGIMIMETKLHLPDIWAKSLPVIISVSLILCCMGGVSTIHPSTPDFVTSPASAVVGEINGYSCNSTQKWIAITGWPHQDMEYTYHIMRSGMHAVNAYYAYYLDTMLPIFYNIGGKTYSIADFIIDTNYLQTGELYDENYLSMVNGVPISRPDNVLPNVFILRGDNILETNIIEFSSDMVVVTGTYKKGDVIILKSAYYEGWKVNGIDAVPIGNMIGIELVKDTNQVTFEFNPWYFWIGSILSIFGVISLFLLIIFRKRINYFIYNR